MDLSNPEQLYYNRNYMTPGEPQNEPVLKRFRAAAAEVYGDLLDRVVLS